MDRHVEDFTRAACERIGPEDPAGALAIALWSRFHASPTPVVYVATSSSRALMIAEMLSALDPSFRVAHLPAWDALPYDRNSPSRRTMGLRAGVFRWLIDPDFRPHIIVTSVRALAQRTPPPDVWAEAHIDLRAGDRITPEEIARTLERFGYGSEDQAEEPGVFALGGQVIDIFPAAAPRPCRVEFAEGVITEIRSFDAVTQRSVVEADVLRVDPGSEIVRLNVADPEPLRPGAEHRLSAFYPKLATLMDYVPGLKLVIEQRAINRAQDFFEQLEDAFESEKALVEARQRPDQIPPPPDRLYLTRTEWADWLKDRLIAMTAVSDPDTGSETLPVFAAQSRGSSAFAQFAQRWLKSGTIVLATRSARETAALTRRLPEPARKMVQAPSIGEILALDPGHVAQLSLPLSRGFIFGKIAFITASDVLGSLARGARREQQSVLHAGELTIGSPAVHLDHGIGIVEGLEMVSDPASGLDQDVLRLAFADSRLMAPVRELWKIWPYDAEPGAVTLDNLGGTAWPSRRARLEEDITEAARYLVDLTRERARQKAPRLSPPPHLYERFAARFPYTLTPDQSAAIRDVIADLASGTPMDRLICGDVGYGKTEVALHATAVAALSGKQVAIVAPTTVLARQHLETFQRRFRGLGLRVVHLSRLVPPAEARSAKQLLADGEAQIVIGTHAILSKTVCFSDLALVIVDEEQRFGSVQKTALNHLAKGLHRLSMTATPIPRTLQTALIGARDLSILATPPAARTPVRTLLLPFEPETVRHALLHERDRGGQSFVVCPRIEDISQLRERLEALSLGLSIAVIHGKMPPAEVDDILLRFSEGDADVLLSTNIIESGLDIPNANTMLVWRPDRFGLAQLHQLRGRVGRGTRRGILYLLRDEAVTLPATAERRLRALEQLDRLGAGFEISARDLAQRGAGDLVGDKQAGHMKLIGADLYEHLLRRAISEAEGEPLGPDWMPELRTGLSALIPQAYVPEPDVRLSIYRRLALLRDEDEVRDMSLELEDRFGPVPVEAEQLLREARLAVLCRAMGFIKLDIGPAAIAITTLDPDCETCSAFMAREGFERRQDRFVLKQVLHDQVEKIEFLDRLAEALSEARG